MLRITAVSLDGPHEKPPGCADGQVEVEPVGDVRVVDGRMRYYNVFGPHI